MVEEITLKQYRRDDGILIPVYLESRRSFVLRNCIMRSNLSADHYITRGDHAHRETTQWMLACNGSPIFETDIAIKMMRGDVLYKVNPMTWIRLTLRPEDCVVVWCDKEYDENDYIRDYEEFKRLINEKLA